MVPPEPESLLQGSTTVSSTLDPLAAATTHVAASNGGYCQHNEAFFSQPEWESIIEQQRRELEARNEAAWQAAQQEQQQAEQQPAEQQPAEQPAAQGAEGD